MTGEFIVFLLFLTVITTAFLTGYKGFLSDDIDRENKWRAFERRDRRDKR